MSIQLSMFSIITVIMGPPNGPEMDQYCFTRWCLSTSSVVVCNTAGGRAGRVRGRSAGQYGYVPLGRHLVTVIIKHITCSFSHFLKCLAKLVTVNSRFFSL